jgi:hypothetical protein
MHIVNLTTYLNDHLAGSVGAIELLDHLIEVWEGTSLETDLGSLRAEIEADQNLLKQLLERFDTQESVVKKAGAWIAEKVMRGKMRTADTMEGELGMLEAFEVLGLGIQGKLALWTALAVAEDGQPTFDLDLPNLQIRAQDQFQKVEVLRLQTARRAFA